MKLENLKVNVSLKANNNNEVLINFELGSYELTPQEHADELRMMEKLLPLLNSALNELTAEMATADADNKKQD